MHERFARIDHHRLGTAKDASNYSGHSRESLGERVPVHEDQVVSGIAQRLHEHCVQPARRLIGGPIVVPQADVPLPHARQERGLRHDEDALVLAPPAYADHGFRLLASRGRLHRLRDRGCHREPMDGGPRRLAVLGGATRGTAAGELGRQEEPRRGAHPVLCRPPREGDGNHKAAADLAPPHGLLVDQYTSPSAALHHHSHADGHHGGQWALRQRCRSVAHCSATITPWRRVVLLAAGSGTSTSIGLRILPPLLPLHRLGPPAELLGDVGGQVLCVGR
mmetsp:Transcript_18699/g.58733  ORF Transcript_18699/g.58733 Transcript_18699/m.58733 type:complete len:278 (-) Transcript_18699:443-1276(-)